MSKIHQSLQRQLFQKVP